MNYEAIKNYRGYIFDLDGTLINSMPFHAKAWMQVAREHGFAILESEIYAMGGSASRDIASYYLQKGNPVGDIEAFVKRKIDVFQEHIPEIIVFDRISAILKDAHDRGAKTAVGTGTRTANALRILKEKGLIDYVDELVSADDVHRHKPNPDTFVLAAQRLGLAPSECLVFEDGQLGVLAAINGAFDCIEVSNNEMINFFQVER
ncbi:MAG: HAD family hydrolase [Succinivibrio sp.]